MLSSDETPRRPSAFITTTRQSPSSGSHSSVCSPEPDDDATQNSWSPGGPSGSPPGLRAVARLVLEIRHDVVLDAFEVAVDLGLGADPDEDRTVALAADAHRSEEGVECPLGPSGLDVRALGHDRVRRGPEVLGRRHEEAVVVALCLVDRDQRAPAREQAEGEDRRDAADDDQDDPARSASFTRGLERRRRRRDRRRLSRGRGRRCRRRHGRGVLSSLIEAERRIRVGHETRVDGDARHPPVESEDEVEDASSGSAS